MVGWVQFSVVVVVMGQREYVLVDLVVVATDKSGSEELNAQVG